jgi:type IV pilus assembly protein PilX
MSPFAKFRRPRRQNGAALVIVLILLLVMTWMGVSSMRGTAMGERMSAGIYDRSISFQAAETSLREGEALIAAKTPMPASGCNAGLCARRAAISGTDTLRWEDPAVAWREASTQLDVDNSGTTIIADPEFIIEGMGDAPNWPGCDREIPINEKCMSPRYRVTARSSEANRARVVLQSNVSGF